MNSTLGGVFFAGPAGAPQSPLVLGFIEGSQGSLNGITCILVRARVSTVVETSSIEFIKNENPFDNFLGGPAADDIEALL